MDKLRIIGGNRLSGEVTISGAKNAALPILCATLLTAEPVVLRNVPALNDIHTTLKVLGQLGVNIQWLDDGVVQLQAHRRHHVAGL